MKPSFDTELSQLRIPEPLRKNVSFMKIIAALFYHGNQPMSAAQLVVAVRNMRLLALSRGETPKSTVQGIISFSRKTARHLEEEDPFDIDKDESGRCVTYRIAACVLNNTTLPAMQIVPEEPVTSSSLLGRDGLVTTKRLRKSPVFYEPETTVRTDRRRAKTLKTRPKPPKPAVPPPLPPPEIPTDDTIHSWCSSLLTDSPTHPSIDTTHANYSLASHFAVSQQKGYSYPRFRSQEKIKIPKEHCEDMFRVAEVCSPGACVVGRMFILADGHGGHGCAQFFVEKTPAAVQQVCTHYTADQFDSQEVHLRFERDIKLMVDDLDEEYLALKRRQLEDLQTVENDGCTLVINLFFGDWLVNVNVGDSRSIVVASTQSKDCGMDILFASQDHKPYLEHLAREILANGGEFVDAVQNRVIKVELETLKEDGNRYTKRLALKHARIRPRDHPMLPKDHSMLPKSAHHKVRTREARIPSLNVARSCGDLDFKMKDGSKIISCEPDVTFVKVCPNQGQFLWMSTDGTFDYMYEELADRQNKAIARRLGSMAYEPTKDVLVNTSRFFVNREGVHGFFASKLQDYDDCTVLLVRI
ncbi:phosphatase 2C-like domain-containing protein [Spinellus fusiger]|nr:phosphatase 2C-like domain-containing protein [Spinellus fusiger]